MGVQRALYGESGVQGFSRCSDFKNARSLPLVSDVEKVEINDRLNPALASTVLKYNLVFIRLSIWI